MPSPWHDSVKQLFCEKPEFAVEILRDLMGVADLPAGLPARLESPSFNDRPSNDFEADAVVVAGPVWDPVRGIIVEVQQAKDPRKHQDMARYAAALWLLLRCPVDVLVIAPSERVASFYAKPVITTLPGYIPTPRALWPDMVPVITDPARVTANPSLAALSLMLHGQNPQVCEAFVYGLAALPPEHVLKYYEYGYCMSSTSVRRILEELVASSAWPVYSPFAKEHFGRGLAEGKAEGKAEGAIEGEGRAILLVLQARGIEVSSEERARITSCADRDQLERWVSRSAVVKTASELFESP
jgi:hypothetical protein